MLTFLNRLQFLEPMDKFYLELAERRLLKLNSSDLFVKKHDWIRKQSAIHHPDSQKVRQVVGRTNKR